MAIVTWLCRPPVGPYIQKWELLITPHLVRFAKQTTDSQPVTSDRLVLLDRKENWSHSSFLRVHKAPAAGAIVRFQLGGGLGANFAKVFLLFLLCFLFLFLFFFCVMFLCFLFTCRPDLTGADPLYKSNFIESKDFFYLYGKVISPGVVI